MVSSCEADCISNGYKSTFTGSLLDRRPIVASYATRCTLIALGLVPTTVSTSAVAQASPTPLVSPLSECLPSINVSSLSGRVDGAVEQRLEEIYQADQADRRIMVEKPHLTSDEVMKIVINDFRRRQEVYNYIISSRVASGRAFYIAALIFQHGDCPDHYKFATELAAKAIELGYEENRWLYAAALDRYLLSIGEREKFGTQTTGVCPGTLEFYDPETTDEERAVYDVPTLKELKSRKPYNCSD